MLDVAPGFAQEAEAIMIRKAVERGRFKDARTLAERARMRSIHYRQFIEDRLFQVRRSAGRVVWSEEVLPELDEARTHLSERRKHEVAIIESIREHIAHARDDTRAHLVDLKNTIDECRQRHAALFERVMNASEEFRRIQVNAFRARYTQNVPDLEDRILVPLLASPKMNFLYGEEARKHGAHTIGIRPEHIRISTNDGEWKGTVGVSEHLGADTFFHVRCEELGGTLTVRADGDNPLQYGDSVLLAPELAKLHRFDADGLRIS